MRILVRWQKKRPNSTQELFTLIVRFARQIFAPGVIIDRFIYFPTDLLQYWSIEMAILNSMWVCQYTKTWLMR